MAESAPELYASLLTYSSIFAYYTDPGAGTLVWQLLLAAFFGGMFYIRRLKDLVINRKKIASRTEQSN